MSTIDRIRVISDEMAALDREGQAADFHQALEALKAAAVNVGRAWSGSWLGYQANVYYRDFAPAPAGAHFSQEWGLPKSFGSDTVGEWQEFTAEEVHNGIRNLAGSPNMTQIFSVARAAAERAMEAKAMLESLLAALTRNLGPDAKLTTLRTELEAIRMVEVSEILNSRRPNRQVITRDMRAVNQNSQVPGHLKIIAQVDAARCPFMAAKELARLARHIAVHAEALTIEAPQLKNHAQPSRVFIGHGHSPVWRELKDYIKDDLNLAPDEFNRLPTAGVATVDRLRQMLDASAIALLVLTAEDERQDGAMQARMNVVHEVGLFQGRLGFNRAIVLLEEGCAEFTNIAGIGHIGFPTGRISACFHEVRAVLIREGLVDAGRTNRSVLDL